MIISVKEDLYLPDTLLHLPEAHSQSELMFLRQHERSSFSLLTAVQQDLIFQQHHLQNSGSRSCTQMIFCLRLCCAFFLHFQQHFCGRGFLGLLIIESKYRSRFVVDDIPCTLSKAVWRISHLVRKMQYQL